MSALIPRTVENSDLNPVPVKIIPGNIVQTYGDANSVAASVLTNVVTYTVTAGKTFKLLRVDASGTNKARYEVHVAGSPVMVKRTYFTEYNTEFVFEGFDVSAGTLIELKVFHTRTATGDFDGQIVGVEV